MALKASYLNPKREYTEKQLAFLEALGSTAQGNIRMAMREAGYSDSTHQKEVINLLQDEMIAIANTILATHSAQAAFGLVGVLDEPTAMGAKNAITAATQVLDRVGIVKKEKVEVSTDTGGLFILPPKKDDESN
jgi:dihydroxyacetone kinase-like predicted kinase